MSDSEFGIWTLPATLAAARIAAGSRFEPAHYDAAEREARRMGHTEITRDDVMSVAIAIESQDAAICAVCGRFHSAPACSAEAE